MRGIRSFVLLTTASLCLAVCLLTYRWQQGKSDIQSPLKHRPLDQDLLVSPVFFDSVEAGRINGSWWYAKDVKFDLTIKRSLTELNNFCDEDKKKRRRRRCNYSNITSVQNERDVYHTYSSVPLEQFLKTDLTIVCDYVVFSPFYAESSAKQSAKYLKYADWLRFHYADLPQGCFFIVYVPNVGVPGLMGKVRGLVLMHLLVTRGVIVSQKSFNNPPDSSVMGIYGVHKHSDSHLLPWIVLTDLDMIITNKKKSLLTLLDQVDDALSRPAAVQNPKEMPRSLADVDMIIAGGYLCFMRETSLNTGFVIMKPTESVLCFLSRVLTPLPASYRYNRESDQWNMARVLGDDYGFNSLGKVCGNSTIWKRIRDENLLVSVLKESQMSVDSECWNQDDDSLAIREPGVALIVSPRWMCTEGCKRQLPDHVKKDLPVYERYRFWRPGDWQAHFYGCGHPTKPSDVQYFVNSMINNSDDVEIPKYMESYNWSAPDAFHF